MLVLNKLIPFKGYKAISIWPFIFVRKDCSFNSTDFNHERIHLRQLLELLVIPFYIIYFIEWIFKGYKATSFEKEAYTYEEDLGYLKRRKIFAQWRK